MRIPKKNQKTPKPLTISVVGGRINVKKIYNHEYPTQIRAKIKKKYITLCLNNLFFSPVSYTHLTLPTNREV